MLKSKLINLLEERLTKGPINFSMEVTVFDGKNVDLTGAILLAAGFELREPKFLYSVDYVVHYPHIADEWFNFEEKEIGCSADCSLPFALARQTWAKEYGKVSAKRLPLHADDWIFLFKNVKAIEDELLVDPDATLKYVEKSNVIDWFKSHIAYKREGSYFRIYLPNDTSMLIEPPYNIKSIVKIVEKILKMHHNDRNVLAFVLEKLGKNSVLKPPII